ncbi:MAG: NUDIX hydrolase [Deltaproteobacteria bacterium]|nr:NUDIX hydrolase [Deltaproteobacteria bacterium]
MIALLRRYALRHPGEDATTNRVLALLEAEPRCFERDAFHPGHITASAWIVSRESRAVLLTHHRKLDRWLQLGGHTDGEVDVLASALREAREESGLGDFGVIPGEGGPVVLDVDVHAIPARGDEPAHEHHDIRFLLETSEHAPLERQQAESKALRWFPAAGIEARFSEESLARMARKAARWLARTPPGPA